MVTIKDIASHLSVSASTVGRALADDPRISSAMKQRVAEVADQMGYVANRAARMMRGVSSNLVGLVVPDVRNSFYSTIAHALSKCLENNGFQLTLSETDDDRNIEMKHLRELTSVGVAGIIIVATGRPHIESIRLLQRTPHIQLLRKSGALSNQWFGIDDRQALFIATKHLLDLGHRRIGYIGGHEDLTTGAARLQGFRDALATQRDARGVEKLGPPSSSEFGRAALGSLLDAKVRLTAVAMGSVQATIGAIEELAARQITIPNNLSIVGFGDDRGFGWWGPGLTTVSLPVSDLATASGLWFVHQLKQKPFSQAAYGAISPPTLVVRGSTRSIERS